jgi:hypothetical protein
MDMRDVNNSIDLNKIPATPAKVDNASKTDPQVPQPTSDGGDKVVKDFSNQPAEALGRSQVQGANKIEQDANFAAKNPEKVAKATKLFDMVYDNELAKGAKPEEAYKQAADVMNVYVNEKID